MLIADTRPHVFDPRGPNPSKAGHEAPRGWLPWRIDEGTGVTRWIETDFPGFSDPFLCEPFFGWCVARARVKVPPRRELETDLSALRAAASQLPEVQPAGIIFHVSRCGSTLVSNALAFAHNALVLSEVASFDQMMSMAGSPVPYWSRTGRQGLRDLTTVFAHYRGLPPRQVVVKAGLGKTLDLGTVRAVWPDVPYVVMIRAPLEVVVSNVIKPPTQLQLWYQEPQWCPLGVPPPVVLDRGPREFCAWVLGRVYQEALRQLDEKCAVLDYRDLTVDSVLRVAARFDLRIPAERLGLFRETFVFDAKAPGKEFQSDIETKRRAADPELLDATKRWVLASYDGLLGSDLRLADI
jgi:hypothetical protein